MTTKVQRYRRSGTIWIHIVLAFGAMLMVAPFLWMLLTSFKTYGESIQVPPIIFPKHFQWINYLEVFKRQPFLDYYINTILITVAKTAGQLALCTFAAYAFARIPFPGRNASFIVVLSVLMVPLPVFIIPRYLIMADLGWLNTQIAVIVPGLASAFGVFLLRQFFMTLPKELDEAAMLDGCNHFQIFCRILLPLSKPGLLAFSIFSILGSWNELLWPLIVIRSSERRPLTAGLATLQEQHDFMSDQTLMMAGSTLAVLPMILLFIVLQRHFIEGIALTGSKR
jgi:multiple sugar transport system permease protein